MKYLRTALMLIGLFSAAPLLAAEQTVKFDVPDMFCASCPYIVEAAMGGVEGVISVMADIDSRTAIVVFDDEITTISDIALASTNSGYEAFLIDAES